jgi:hypothetical protein
MIKRSAPVAIALAFAAFTTPLHAHADDGDKAACADLAEGDACTDSDGAEGTCVPDASDANVLSCEDSASADDSSGGCSASASRGGDRSIAWLATLGLISAIGASRRARGDRR